MMSNRFKQLDLNLLKVLKVLIEVKNTRKASELLFTSQPSISRSLQKLRDYFDDELFIRSQHGLEPTTKLLEIKQTLLPVLSQLEQVLEPESEFDVAQFDGTVNIAINGFIANSISAKLTQILLAQAPQVKVNIVDWGSHTLDLLTSGEVDLGVNYYPLELSKQVYQKRVASDDFVLVCRTGHPLANTLLKSDQQEPLQLASLVVSDWNDNIALAPNVLADVGIKTEVKIRSTYLHSLLSIVKQSDVLFPCSKLLANSLSNEFSFVQFPHMPNMPNGDIGMTIGRKHRNQPKMRWLESCIEEVFRG
ncbi:LysR family transcriptional regulator [Vibrio sp. Isolate33]|uniref:LysR family transcriptional regulator n=1 Tax=Vibrio sp. Isolate33 TaxID=2908539 RepID=UPI001EFC3147|nr:LysR family transcriptional regulator [Vibrio sp. Isolate33]MCG9543528.1 LysR family transcriptional regulator [Vibrio sp. Isolate33]